MTRTGAEGGSEAGMRPIATGVRIKVKHEWLAEVRQRRGKGDAKVQQSQSRVEAGATQKGKAFLALLIKAGMPSSGIRVTNRVKQGDKHGMTGVISRVRQGFQTG